jgi:hypothetical protein
MIVPERRERRTHTQQRGATNRGFRIERRLKGRGKQVVYTLGLQPFESVGVLHIESSDPKQKQSLLEGIERERCKIKREVIASIFKVAKYGCFVIEIK